MFFSKFIDFDFINLPLSNIAFVHLPSPFQYNHFQYKPFLLAAVLPSYHYLWQKVSNRPRKKDY